jgi:hypothetical protein
MRLLVFFMFGFIAIDLSAQMNYITENDSFLYWQPGVKLQYEDYLGDTSTSGMELCRKYNIHNIGEVHIESVLDVPINEKKRGKLLEKVYIAPVICKHCSFSIKQDSIEMLHDQIYFDIAEYCSRIARMRLDSLREFMPGYGTYWLKFSTVTAEMDELMHGMFGSYTYQVLAQKDSLAYNNWRVSIDKGLLKTKEFATKPEECYRLLIYKPIDKEYERSEFIGPPLKKNK